MLLCRKLQTPRTHKKEHLIQCRTNWHEAVRREHEIVTVGVGLIDLTPFAKFIVEGDDARKYLDHLVAGTVPKEGRTSVVHALTPAGKVYAELTLTGMSGGRFMVVTGSGVEGHDLRHMHEVAREGDFDVSIDNVTDDINVLREEDVTNFLVALDSINLRDLMTRDHAT